jgi:LytS/YehU family sensor histidine kinase
MTSSASTSSLPLKPLILLLSAIWGTFFVVLGLITWAWLGIQPASLPIGFGANTVIGLAASGLICVVWRRTAKAPPQWRRLIVGSTLVIDLFIYRALLAVHGYSSKDVVDVIQNVSLYIWVYGLLFLGLAQFEASARAALNAKLAQEAKLEALRLQLNPHFLFNTLNAISSLIVTGRPQQADAMVIKLAEFLRATAGTEQRSVNRLADDLEMASAYLQIEQARFETIDPRIDCPEELFDALVPSLILQPLLENAVKYAVAPARGQASIAIQARANQGRLHIVVSDSGPRGGAVPVARGGIGLANTRARLNALYGEEAHLNTTSCDDGFCCEIVLPLSFERSAA